MRHRILSFTAAAIALSCTYYSDDCESTLTCESPYPVEPYCDGKWYFTKTDGSICDDPSECSSDGQCCTDDGVCPYCPELDEAGVWRFPKDSTKVWKYDQRDILSPDGLDCALSDSNSGSGGQSGSGGSQSASGGQSGSAGPDSTAGGAHAAGAAGSAHAAGAGGAAGSAGSAYAAGAGTAGTAGAAGAAGDSAHAGAPGAGAAGAPNPCSGGPYAGPDEDLCAIDDAYAVFVALHGQATATGTSADPVSSLEAALAIAAERDIHSIYLCAQRDGVAADYSEPLQLSDTEAISLYGGFDCSNGLWTYDKISLKATFSLAAAEPFSIDSSSDIDLVDLAVVVASPSAPGESSRAMAIVDSSQIQLRRVVLDAATAPAGAEAISQAYLFDSIDALAGNDGTATAAGASKTCSCANDETSIGGLGGGVTADGQPGTGGFPTRADMLGGEAGTLVTLDSQSVCTDGGAGAPGPDRSPSSGALSYGDLTLDGWNPAPGFDGADGAPGQGGGGGASSPLAGGGGGGGCGGCGGQGAPAGQGGGASIALTLLDSTVTLSECSLTAGDGGDGGSGAAGQLGQRRSALADFAGWGGRANGGSCAGGNGGRGGNGGASGGGAGGISAGILWQGNAPILAGDTAITVGSPGLGGDAALDADNAGIPGIAVESADADSLPTP